MCLWSLSWQEGFVVSGRSSQPFLRPATLIPHRSGCDFGFAERGEDVEKKVRRSGDDRSVKQLEAGRTAADMGRDLGVSKHTIYAWKAKYRGLDVNEAQRLRQLEDEDHRPRSS